ncbi:MAG: NAD-dependent epimerase/dehydratase [Acidobacteria bacterium]|nr:NAD-dependent epimerase/dehydratase [Acidobacteriota bacterium]
MRRVLVTGSSGFIGRAVVPLLQARGFEVHAASRASGNEVPATGVIRHRHDLLSDDPTPLMGSVRPDFLLHLAWYAQPADYRVSDENLRWLDASRRLVTAFGEAGGTRAVFAGTCAETIEPDTPYAANKRELREFVLGLPLTIAWGRIFFLFGPHEFATRFVPSIVRPLLAGGEASCHRPELRRDYLYVDDVAGAFAALVDSTVTGEVDIGCGEALRLGSIADAIAEKIGRGVLRYGEGNGGGPEIIVADSRRLREEVGFTPACDLDAALDATIDWWRRTEGAP